MAVLIRHGWTDWDFEPTPTIHSLKRMAADLEGARGAEAEQSARDEGVRWLDAAGHDPKRPLVASCGSGVTACVVAFGLYLIGHKEVAIYDGSWTEWASDGSRPIATGPA